MLLFILYLKLIAASIVGLGIQLVAKNKSLQEKAKISNVKYTFGQFLKDDQLTIIGTLLTISLFFLIVGDGINPDRMKLADEPIEFAWGWIVLSRKIIYASVLTILFATAGYMGMDLALRIFSVANKKINNVIDYKTTEADKATGTLDTPTSVK